MFDVAAALFWDDEETSTSFRRFKGKQSEAATRVMQRSWVCQ